MSKRTYSTVSLAKLKGHEDATRQCQESESTDTPSGGWDSWLIDGIGCDATWALFGEESESAKDEWTETMKAKLAAYHEGAMEACAEIDNDSTISGGPHVEGIERGQVEFTGLISLGDQIQSIECGWQGRVTGFEKYHGDDCTYLVCHHVSGGKIEEDDKRWFDPRDVRLLRKAPMTFEEFQKTTLGQRVIAEGYDTCEIADTLAGLCPGTGTFACNENGIVTVAHVIRAAIVERVLRTVTAHTRNEEKSIENIHIN